MQKRIADIISKTITGITLSDEDRTILDGWLNESDKNRIEYEFLTGINYTVNTTDLENNKSLILNSIHTRIYKGQKFIRNLWIASASVAAVALVFFVGRFSASSAYPKIGKQEIVFNEINVPEGAKSQVTLADGTKVWLNGGSKFRYPSTFVAKSREVQLDGEAFFDVAQDKSKPFLVKAGRIQIKVLGTAFNVKSYSVDKTIETTLVRGLVEIREIKGKKLTAPVLIKPNQKAIFVKEESSLTINPAVKNDQLKELPDKLPGISIKQVNTVPITSWKEQALVFDNITFEDVATTLERWYGIKVNIENETLRGYRYKGRFSHNETIYEVLEVIKVTTPIKYEVKNYEINIGLK